MRPDFCAFILTHGRPDRVQTYKQVRRNGYTGPIFLVVDDEDPTLPEYQQRFRQEVLVFSKAEIAETFDEGDNFQDRRAIIYARNQTWKLAKELGYKYFIQLDDDYHGFEYYFDREGRYNYQMVLDLDSLWEAMVEFHEACPQILSVAMSQGGDHIGGAEGKKVIGTKRKAMNTFICSVDRPFQFVGRVNEDVNTYTSLQRRGGVFLTILAVKCVQMESQRQSGGMTEMYLDSGTYVKSFYSVMYAPSCVKVSMLTDWQRQHRALPHEPEYQGGRRGGRIHHKVKWRCAAPQILPESFKKSVKGRGKKHGREEEKDPNG